MRRRFVTFARRPTSAAGAWYRYPEPQGRTYRVVELHSAAIAEELFDYCQILLAVILPVGWRELFRVHGPAGLVEIERRSGWFDETDPGGVLDRLVEEARLAGYDPRSDRFGRVDGSTGRFLPEEDPA